MSADNRICIQQWMSQWYVWHGSCSMTYYEPPFGCDDVFDTERQALAFAAKEEVEIGYLEGGVTIVDVHEQAAALAETIEMCEKRLDNLKRTGLQYPL